MEHPANKSKTLPALEFVAGKGRIFLAAVFALSLLFILISAPIRSNVYGGGGFLRNNDSFGYYAYLPALVLYGDLDYTAVYREWCRKYDLQPAPAVVETGKFTNLWTVGIAILWAPFFLIGHALALVFGLPADGISPVYQVPVACGTALFFFLGLGVFFSDLRKLFSESLAFVIALGIFTTTFFLDYVLYENFMSHALTFFAAAMYLRYILRIDQNHPASPRVGHYAGAAFWAGMVALIRPQSIFIGIVLILLFLRDAVQLLRRKESLGTAAKNLIPALLCSLLTPLVFVPQMLIWKHDFGKALTIPQVEDYIRWGSPHMIGILFSRWHGFFYWHPVFLFTVIALVWCLFSKGTKVSRVFWTGTAVAFLLTWYLNACVRDWWAGNSFGSRRFDALAPFLFLALACLIDRIRLMEHRPGSILLAFLALSALNGIVWIIYVLDLLPAIFPIGDPPWF